MCDVFLDREQRYKNGWLLVVDLWAVEMASFKRPEVMQGLVCSACELT